VFANSVHMIILLGMNRGDLTNMHWERRQPLLPPQQPKTGRPAVDHRRLLNGMLGILRTGAPWRDLPERYGPWRTVASRFYRWQKAGLWSQLLAAVQTQADAASQLKWDRHSLDGPLIRAHQQAAGANTGTQRPKPSAGAGAVSVPKSTCGLQGAAS
jgi:transposase